MNIISGILVKCSDEVLLCRRSLSETYSGYWGIPCGHVNKDENEKHAALREFYEETNLKASKNIKLIGLIPLGESLAYIYLMKVKNRIHPNLKKARDGFEHDLCGWFTFHEIPKKIDEKLKNVIQIGFNL